jgi:Rps23 Pro-64 3,4-dihydroxylase Tpa1-like proline 4-hydroxylase
MSITEQTESDKQELHSLLIQDEPALLCLAISISPEFRFDVVENLAQERSLLFEGIENLKQRADIVRVQIAQRTNIIALLNKEDCKQGLSKDNDSSFSCLLAAIPQKSRFETGENLADERTLLFVELDDLAFQIRQLLSKIDQYTKAITFLTDN